MSVLFDQLGNDKHVTDIPKFAYFLHKYKNFFNITDTSLNCIQSHNQIIVIILLRL